MEIRRANSTTRDEADFRVEVVLDIRVLREKIPVLKVAKSIAIFEVETATSTTANTVFATPISS